MFRRQTRTKATGNLFDHGPLTAIDLFAGGGGLTVGLKRAGFDVVAAVENEPNAADTYRSNHGDVKLFERDIAEVTGTDLNVHSPDGQIDLLAGCPPCQGFTSLTAKYNRSDLRNALIREMGRLVREVEPKAVMLENVPRIRTRGKELYKEFVGTLKDHGYKISDRSLGVLQVANYGVPQNRRRFVLLAGKGFEIPLPSPTHSRDGNEHRQKWKTLRDVLSQFDAGSPPTLSEAQDQDGPQGENWHVVRDISEKNKERLREAKPGESRKSIPRKLRPDCHEDDDYDGFSNVYGRMTWDQTPVTITSGCTTPSKGRFGHPEELRTISVREAALIQTFPLDYEIDTPYMKYACQIVGNALPCDFAEVVSEACHEALHQREVA
jgi:DNA (cytosine-5)-methyltransferase 1